jgi:hypothetical protein
MIDIDGLSIDQLEELRDACSRRLLELRKTTGLALPDMLRLLEEVKVVLRDQHKEWHSLDSWQWIDGEIRFWLNPKQQDRYNAGWYTIDELISWSREIGPVVVDADNLWEEADGVQITWLPTEQNPESQNSLLPTR